MKNNKTLWIIVSAIVFIFLIILAVKGLSNNTNTTREETPEPNSILSFEQCADAGYPVQESYPRRCITPDGRSFTEEGMGNNNQNFKITYNNASADMIKVELPYPGAVTAKKFNVIGTVRGNWFFEATFPVKVLDKNGKVLATAIAHAQDDWMTTEFVPFMAEVKVPESYIGPATLVLSKDNPSGLAKNDASISFLFTIEY